MLASAAHHQVESALSAITGSSHDDDVESGGKGTEVAEVRDAGMRRGRPGRRSQ